MNEKIVREKIRNVINEINKGKMKLSKNEKWFLVNLSSTGLENLVFNDEIKMAKRLIELGLVFENKIGVRKGEGEFQVGVTKEGRKLAKKLEKEVYKNQ